METESAKIDNDPRDKRWTVFWNEFEEFREAEYKKLACKLGIELPRVVVDDDILDKMDDRDLRFYSNSLAFDALLDEMGREKFSEWYKFIENERENRAAVLNEIIEKASREAAEVRGAYLKTIETTAEEIFEIEQINGEEFGEETPRIKSGPFIYVFHRLAVSALGSDFTTALEWRRKLYHCYLDESYWRLGYVGLPSKDPNYPYSSLKITRPLTFEQFFQATRELILDNKILVHRFSKRKYPNSLLLEAFPNITQALVDHPNEGTYGEYKKLCGGFHELLDGRVYDKLYGDYEKKYHEWILENESDSTIEDMRTIYDPYVRDIDFLSFSHE